MLSDWIDRLYSDALDIGISIETFWNSSLSEILDMMESYKRVQYEKTRERILFMYQHAEWTAQHIAAKFDSKQRVPYPWDSFPEMFSVEKEVFEENRQKQELEEFKERRRNYYNYKNKQRASES